MSLAEVKLLPGADDLLRLHAEELPQKDEVCGAFWATLALRLGGFKDIDQDAAAHAAGTTISASLPPGALPPGEEGRADFRLRPPAAHDPAASGTAASGVSRAIAELSGGRLAAVPATGPWTPARVRELLERAATRSPVTLIANLDTAELWGSRPSGVQVVRYLVSGDDGCGPAADWDVGHFIALLGSVRGPAGSLVLCADTYRSLGWQGLHLQPSERVASALTRADGAEGGMLCVAAADEAPRLAEQLRDDGFEIRLWDNGSADRGAP